MNAFRTLAALPAVFLLHSAFAFNPGWTPPGAADTLKREYTIDEVVVTSTRRDVASSLAPSAVSVVSREAIEALPGTLLSSALSWTPGLSLRAYGGGASVQTISLRGMSPEHTLMLVDGQRANSFQNGLADFGILCSSEVERVEIVRGGSSSLYGSEAVGGVINVITRPPGEGIHGAASASFGSHHSRGQGFRFEAGENGTGLRASLSREQGRGDYEYRFNDGREETTLTRSGEDFAVTTADARGDWRLNPALRATATYSSVYAQRGSPGVVTDPHSGGRGRLSDLLEYLRGAIDWDAASGVTLRVSGSAHYGVEHYDDPGQLLNGTTLHSIYANHDDIITPEALFTFSPAFSGLAGLEYARGSLQSSETSDALRTQRSAFISTQHAFPLPWQAPFEVLLYPSIRYDDYSDVRGDVSPRLGVNIGLLKEPALRLRASYGRSFRAPVLNDLYWVQGGNPLLRPERAVSFDAGLRCDLEFFGSLRIDASYFSIDSRDRIVWVPASGSFWSPKNIARATSRGAEAEADWTGFDGVLRLSLNATWTNARKASADYAGDPTEGKRLIYEPAETVNALAEARWGRAALSLRHSWISYRYTTEINDRYLPAYAIECAALRYGLPLGAFNASLKAEVNNLLNTSYQVVALYPTPLREFRLGLEAGL